MGKIIREELSHEFSLSDIQNEGERFIFTAKSLSEDFECEKVLKKLAKDSFNKPLVWRHTHPMQEGSEQTHIYGRVLESKYKDGFINSTYELYSHTEDHQDLIDLIIKRFENDDPLGISMHYRKYVDIEKEKVIHVDVYEHSGTPIPACVNCKTNNYGIKMAKNEDETKDEEKEEDKKENPLAKKIKDLEDKLNSKSEKLEEYASTINVLEQKLEAKADEKMTLEEKVENLKETVQKLEKKPYIDQLFELEQDKDLLEFYESKDIEFLQKRYEQKKDEIDVRVETEEMEDSASKNTVGSEEELEEKEPKLDEFLRFV